MGCSESLRIGPAERNECGVRSRWRIGMQFASAATKGSLDVRHSAWAAQPESSKTTWRRDALGGRPRSDLTMLLMPPAVLDVPVDALRVAAGMGKPSGGSSRLFRPHSLTNRLVQNLAKTNHHLLGRPKWLSLERGPNGAAFSRLIILFA
jgi:hypothetical protein